VRGTLAIPHPIHQVIYFSLISPMNPGSVSRPRVAGWDALGGEWGAGRGGGLERLEVKNCSHKRMVKTGFKIYLFAKFEK
jgi:hypothetical protein